MSVYKFTSRAVPSPNAPQKPLVRKRAHSGDANCVQVTRVVAPSPAKKPTGGSQHPACAHSQHQILSTTEATAFAAQFWDKKTHRTKASQHEFLATCINVNLEQNVKHAGRQKYTRNRGHQTKCRANFEFLAKYLIHSLDSGDFSVSAKKKINAKKSNNHGIRQHILEEIYADLKEIN